MYRELPEEELDKEYYDMMKFLKSVDPLSEEFRKFVSFGLRS